MDIQEILEKAAGVTVDHKYGSIAIAAKNCNVNSELYYGRYFYPGMKRLLESLNWNVVERPRLPKPEEYPSKDGNYLVMLDCDEHAILINSFKDGNWLLYNGTHIKWWMEVPEFLR